MSTDLSGYSFLLWLLSLCIFAVALILLVRALGIRSAKPQLEARRRAAFLRSFRDWLLLWIILTALTLTALTVLLPGPGALTNVFLLASLVLFVLARRLLSTNPSRAAIPLLLVWLVWIATACPILLFRSGSSETPEVRRARLESGGLRLAWGTMGLLLSLGLLTKSARGFSARFVAALSRKEPIHTYFCEKCGREYALPGMCTRCQQGLSECGWCRECGGTYHFAIGQPCPTHGAPLVQELHTPTGRELLVRLARGIQSI